MVLADGHTSQQATEQILLFRTETGQERHLLAGHPEVHLRLEVPAFANDDVHFEAVLRDVDGEIAARVACADDENPASVEILDVVVLAGVQLLSGELARDVGNVGVPEMSVGNQDAVEDTLIAAGGQHAPSGRSHGSGAGIDGGHGNHFCVEVDEVVVPVAIGVRLDVAPHLVPTGKVRILLGHREALEVGHVA